MITMVSSRKTVLLLFSLLFVMTLLTTTSVSAVHTADTQEITLLSVKRLSNGTYQGGTATLTLDVREGSGAVYIQSFPTSQVDTQTATRIANEVACDLSTADCHNYDFFYTIEAGTSLIGGPSAGAATALLTMSALEDILLDDDMAITGAITSGGIVTPVAGIKEKVKAADEAGLDTVYIPKLSIMQPSTLNLSRLPYNQTLPNATVNETIPLVNDTVANVTDGTAPEEDILEELEEFDIDVVAILSIEEAMIHASDGKYTMSSSKEVIAPKEYVDRMKTTADKLCKRSQQLLSDVPEHKKNTLLYNYSLDFYADSQQAATDNEYYSRASFCYTTNLRLRELLLQNVTQPVLNENYNRLLKAHELFEQQIDDRKLETFSDLETYVIVKERLLESKNYLDQINQSNISSTLLAYSIERYYSSVSWSGFFGMSGEKLQLDERSIHVAAVRELHNVETRLNYLRTFIPEILLRDVSSEVEQVYDYMEEKEYALALFKASKAKAQADLFMSSISLKEGLESEIHEAKVNRTQQLIHEQQDKGFFPILGYSYMEYSKRLVEDDPVSALLFSEYALQLSDLARYFPHDKVSLRWEITEEHIVSFISGFATALIIVMVIGFATARKRTSQRQKRRNPKKIRSKRSQNGKARPVKKTSSKR
ncbi:MAG: S16 family serine protease [Nanobdellota archaeon]